MEVRNARAGRGEALRAATASHANTEGVMGELIVGLYVFVLAVMAGFEVITKVPPTLHTPLMSGANAISGIAVIGALIVAAQAETALVTILGLVAIVMATVNVVGGFLVTDRMLKMFTAGRRKD